MQKLLALSALALLVGGCDQLAIHADPADAVAISNLTVTEFADSAFVAPFVEVQDNTGRSFFASEVTSGVGLGAFRIMQPQHDLYIVLFDRTAAGDLVFLGVSDVFRAGALTGDVTMSVRTQGGLVVGNATLDLP